MKNSTPSSEFEHEDKCPSCGSPCNIHTDLDDNDECNECRNQIDSLEMGQIVPKEFTVPTVEEFFGFINGEIAYPPDFVHRKAIEFAKLHVEAALKEASKEAKITYEYSGNTGSEYCNEYIDKNSILNAYPLTNIK